MGVPGYLAIYAYLLGWHQYDQLWQICYQTGLFLLPLLCLWIGVLSGPFLQHKALSAGVISIKTLLYRSIGMITVLAFAVVPTVHLDAKSIYFHKPCQDHMATDPYAGHTGTTYDQTIPSDLLQQEVVMPVFWYGVLALSNAINNAAMAGVDCQVIRVRQLQQHLDLSFIHDPLLLTELEDFNKACYFPAYAKYRQHDDPPSQRQIIDKDLSHYGKNDIRWPGSHVFMDVPGYYNVLRAQNPVPGFPFDPQRDQIQAQVQGHDQNGEPYCNTWWPVLREQLYNSINSDDRAHLFDMVKSMHLGAAEAVEDATLYALLIKHGSQSIAWIQNYLAHPYDSEADNRQGFGSLFGKVFSKQKMLFSSAVSYPSLIILLNVLPLLQALALMAVIIFLVIGMPLAQYHWRFCYQGALALFAITFLSYIWYLVSYVDQWILGALYQAPALDSSLSAWSKTMLFVGHYLSLGMSPAYQLVDLTIALFYILLPIAWFWALWQLA